MPSTTWIHVWQHLANEWCTFSKILGVSRIVAAATENLAMKPLSESIGIP